MDADMLATGDLASFFASFPMRKLVGEGGTGHKFINAGLLLAKPSMADFNGLIEHAAMNDPPNFFPNLVDCTEQALVNAYFGRPDRLDDGGEHGNKEALALSTRASAAVAVGRPDVKRDYVSHAPLAVHFVRQDRCSKPWSKHDTHLKSWLR